MRNLGYILVSWSCIFLEAFRVSHLCEFVPLVFLSKCEFESKTSLISNGEEDSRLCCGDSVL